MSRRASTSIESNDVNLSNIVLIQIVDLDGCVLALHALQKK